MERTSHSTRCGSQFWWVENVSTCFPQDSKCHHVNRSIGGSKEWLLCNDFLLSVRCYFKIFTHMIVSSSSLQSSLLNSFTGSKTLDLFSDQCTSNFTLIKNHLDSLLQCRLLGSTPGDCDSSGLGMVQKCCCCPLSVDHTFSSSILYLNTTKNSWYPNPN